MVDPILKIDNLHLSLLQGSKRFKVLHGLSFEIFPGEIVGLMGESGSGKSLTASTIFGLLPPSHEVTGRILFEGQDLLSNTVSHPRGHRLSLILQDPDLALNPVISIGRQLTEGLRYHKKISSRQAFKKGAEWLKRVGISDPIKRMSQYPHELSGGMKQRVLIAMALICQPSLLVADEPTTALDLTIQAQILDLLQNLQKEEEMSLLFITHDLGIIARCCHRVLVMLGGELIESGRVEDLFLNPQHAYTRHLLQARRNLTGL